MGEMGRAEISLKIAEKFADNSNSALLDTCRKELPLIKVVPKQTKHQSPAVAYGENEGLRGASKLVKLVETKEKGKFVVANDPLKTGDVVLCENPVAACLLPDFYGSHCHHCFER